MDVLNYTGSRYRPRCKFRTEAVPASGEVPASEVLRRVMAVVERFPETQEAVQAELERIVDEESRCDRGS